MYKGAEMKLDFFQPALFYKISYHLISHQHMKKATRSRHWSPPRRSNRASWTAPHAPAEDGRQKPEFPAVKGFAGKENSGKENPTVPGLTPGKSKPQLGA
jgi:hypothetical protein